MSRDHMLLVRADANARVGSGHLVRSVALAEGWAALGGDVLIMTKCLPDAIPAGISGKFPVAFLNAESSPSEDLGDVCEHVSKLESPWVVCDGYHFDTNYSKTIRAAGARVMLIDDLGDAPNYFADVVLNQNPFAERLEYRCELNTQKLLGTRYVLLRREFADRPRSKRQIADRAHRVLLMMGGGDAANKTRTVMEALRQVPAPGVTVRVIVGPANPNGAGLACEAARSTATRFEVLKNPSDLPDLMAWADLAISGGGGTCWELCYLGVPMALFTLAANQEPMTRALAEIGAAVSLGSPDADPRQIGSVLRSLLDDSAVRERLSQCSRALVDGEGASRVAGVLRQISHRNTEPHPPGGSVAREFRSEHVESRLILRPARMADADQLLAWRNHPDTRAMFFNQVEVSYAEHFEWLETVLNRGDRRLFIAAVGDTSVGTGRVDLGPVGEATVSITIDPDARGCGFGTQLIRLLIDEAAALGLEHLFADVKPHNLRSQRAFSSAGFRRVAESRQVIRFRLDLGPCLTP